MPTGSMSTTQSRCHTFDGTWPNRSGVFLRASRNFAGRILATALLGMRYSRWAGNQAFAVRGEATAWYNEVGVYVVIHVASPKPALSIAEGFVHSEEANLTSPHSGSRASFWMAPTVLRSERLEEPELTQKLNDLYTAEWNLYFNFFIPSVKLIRKTRIGSKIFKIHNKPKTPSQRLIESNAIPDETKEKLSRRVDEFNPFDLRKQMIRKVKNILKEVN